MADGHLASSSGHSSRVSGGDMPYLVHIPVLSASSVVVCQTYGDVSSLLSLFLVAVFIVCLSQCVFADWHREESNGPGYCMGDKDFNLHYSFHFLCSL